MHREYDLTTERWFTWRLLEYMCADRRDQLAIGCAARIELGEYGYRSEHQPGDRTLAWSQ
jgi:hypothetical protein